MEIAQQHTIDDFIRNLIFEEGGLSANTQKSYQTDLMKFAGWLKDQGKQDIVSVQATDIEAYLHHRFQKRLHPRSTARFLSCLRHFYQWLFREGVITEDPAQNIEGPKLGRALPKTLSESAVEALLAAPDLNTALGMRDKALLELLYATGLRVSELVGLKMADLNLRQGVVRVILGKGGKDRLVPLGEESIAWITQYLSSARADLLGAHMADEVFVSQQGRQMTRQTVWHRIKQYAAQAGLVETLSPHTLRHAFATHLLNHGADLRVVQMLLGHSNLSTTTIYTHIAKARMQALHQAHHPRA